MVQQTKKPEKFWNELKRRKVFKVVAMYAGTAFIILQLSEILTPALFLPSWTTRLVMLILIICFPIAVIFSWIFDITPDGIKKTESIEFARKRKSQPSSLKRNLRASNIVIALMAIVIGILFYPKIFRKDTLEKIRTSGERITVAVIPFQNMTDDTTWNVWQDGIQVNLITSLSNNHEELQVRQTESIKNILEGKELINYASITPSLARTISQKLDADIFINGSINKSGSTIRLNAQLVNSKYDDVMKSFQVDGKAENILPLIDSLSIKVSNFLIVTKLKKEIQPDYQNLVSTGDPDAFRYFIYGQNAYYKKEFPAAVNFFSQALSIDSDFIFAAIFLSFSYGNQEMYKEAKKWAGKVYEKRDQMPVWQNTWINWSHAMYMETPHEEIKYLRKLQEFDDQMPLNYGELGYCYLKLGQYDKAIAECEKALNVYDKWGLKPMWVYNYVDLGKAYHRTGKYKKEEKLYKKAEKDFPNDPDLLYRQAILSLTEGKTSVSNKYIEEYLSVLKENSSSEADISKNLARIYSEVNFPEKAEEYYRQALLSEPENPVRMNALAYFLINMDRNVNEGMEIIDKVLVLDPENFNYLQTKGWGLYKQGKYIEAFENLQKSWELRIQNAVYDHEAWSQLEAVKKKVTGSKNK